MDCLVHSLSLNMTLAEKVGERLSEVDRRLITLLGFELVAMGVGTATAQMRVREDMVNWHGFCQGGLIFSLADHAFAYACMSQNMAGVTLSADIIFNNPARLGDLISAEATVLVDKGRTATCDVVVRNQDDVTIAHYRGISYRTRQSVLPD
ncbi:MAG: hotdog fold thioesterase [Candidatus Promineifilaceae bacterium]